MKGHESVAVKIKVGDHFGITLRFCMVPGAKDAKMSLLLRAAPVSDKVFASNGDLLSHYAVRRLGLIFRAEWRQARV